MGSALLLLLLAGGSDPEKRPIDSRGSVQGPQSGAEDGEATLPPVSSLAPPAASPPGAEETRAPARIRDPNTRTGGMEDGALSKTRTAIRLFGDARVKPMYDRRSDAMEGVQITRVSEESFWHELGIREGDIVLEINGRPIEDHNSSVALMNSLSREYVLILRVRSQDGSERYLEYRTPESPDHARR